MIAPITSLVLPAGHDRSPGGRPHWRGARRAFAAGLAVLGAVGRFTAALRQASPAAIFPGRSVAGRRPPVARRSGTPPGPWRFAPRGLSRRWPGFFGSVAAPTLKVPLGFLLATAMSATAAAEPWPATPYSAFDVQRWRTPPAYQPKNILAAKVWPAGVKRVAVLPVATLLSEVPADYFAAHDPVWLSALQASQRAEFVAVSRAELLRWTGRMSFSTTHPLPPDLLARIAERTGAEAVAFLEVTHFSPYGAPTLGLRGRILELAPNRPIWAFDETIHAAEAGTTQLFRDGLGRQDALLSPPSELAGIRISPTKIVGYIARVIVKTLPPRPVGKFSP